MKLLFFKLIQVAIGCREYLRRVPSAKEWNALYTMAQKQTVAGVCFCGLQRLPNEQRACLPELLDFINYLHNVDQKVTLAAIDGINEEYKGLIDPLKKQVEHEAYVTSLIVAIYEAAIEANDYGAKLFLEGFIKEQEEEEKNARDMLDSFKMVEGEKVGVFMLNSEYGKR